MTERIIETVKCYPILYNTSHEDYKNNRVKSKVWDDIAEIIQEKDGDVVKAKWKNLRDSYSKYIRATNTQLGPPSKHVEKYKTWPWAKQMSFLKPFLDFPGLNNETVTEFQYVDIIGPDHDVSSPSQSTFVNTEQYREYEPHNQRHYSHDSPIEKVIEYLQNRNSMEYDETDLIFLGYSKTIKKMPIRHQAKIKFDIAKIIMEAEIEYAEDMDARRNVKPE